MPQICKVRIVNFQYNDGNRLIPDELYDFESEGKGPSDVLINLANGGGKSVLVQLMMQPVIPRAKVAGRKIESFFTRATDHCYIVIEWALDGSKMKLMTGIAMAASDSSANTEQDRGFRIKYYTFISSYLDYQGDYNIISLPLSRKEKGRYVPAGFDDVRNLAKKSGGQLERYSSDDGQKWQERLSQYGIVQGEWRMIEELNSNEDGLSKFFSSLRDSDAVIDRLIIPRIEQKQNLTFSKDDTSLETMLISYAGQFSRQQDIIREREICEGFRDLLGETGTKAEELWKSSDSYESAIRELFGFADALGAEISRQKQKADVLSAESERLQEEKGHIRWEQISEEYYMCKEAFERETARYQEAERAKTDARAGLDEAGKKLRLIECAHYYGKLKDIESRISAISDEITNREKDSESAGRLASLKYSARVAITKEKDRLLPEIEGLSSERAIVESQKAAVEKELTVLENEENKAAETAIKTEAEYDVRRQDNDQTVAGLGIDVFRMFDGRYPLDGLKEWRKGKEKRAEQIRGKTAGLYERLQEIEERRDAIPRELHEVSMQSHALKEEQKGLNEGLLAYNEAKKNALLVYQRYSLDKDRLFTDHAKQFLSGELEVSAATIVSAEREKEATEEAMAAVERGNLHLPGMIVDFLESTGLRYSTVEEYVLAQQKNGNLSKEETQQLLSQFPYAAYGIIIDDKKDIETLYDEAEGKWLPSMLPVFTREDMDKWLRGEAGRFQSLAAYEKKYFLDREAYAIGLRDILQQQETRISRLEEKAQAFREDLAVIETFAVYDEKWESGTRAQLSVCEEQITKTEDVISRLQQEQEDLKQETLTARKEIGELKDQESEIKYSLSGYEQLLVRLKEEENIWEKYEEARKTLHDRKARRDEKAAEKARLDTHLSKILERANELNSLQQALENGLEAVKDATEADVEEGDWSALLVQYQKLLEAQSQDLQQLNNDKNSLIDQKEEKQKEINKRGCLTEEYKGIVYSEEAEQAASRLVENKNAEYLESEEKFAEASGRRGSAEASYNNAVRGLEGYGGKALPENEIARDYERRILEAKERIAKNKTEQETVNETLSGLLITQGTTKSETESRTRPVKYPPVVLEDDYDGQRKKITQQIRDWRRAVLQHEKNVKDGIDRMLAEFGADSADIHLAVMTMKGILSDPSVRGNRYRTLCEHIGAAIHTVTLRIAQIDTDLNEFHKTKDDLIHQCLLQGKQMYDGLVQLSNSSRVKVQERRRQMLKFDIPDAVEENVARAVIAAEIDKGTDEIVARMAAEDHSESEIRKIAGRIVGSKRLLRKYIGAENIVLKAYKIDRNPEHSGYRTWEQTQVNNSGAEKFVVYFAVILALMAYARDSFIDMGDKNNRSVLVLDNPFGPISSKHVLEPMFEISRNYHVQMICLSDISKSDITNCFDFVIRAIVKRLALSSKEQLTHEGNEAIEHGFYRSEQMKLFDSGL